MTTPWSDADLGLLQDVYELQSISMMNSIYYEKRLAVLQFYSFWMEVLTAATASGSGLASVAQIQTEPGRSVWQALALIAAFVAIVRPIYAPGKKIEAYTRQKQGYHTNFFALKKLARSIRYEAVVTADHRRRYDTAYDRHVQLSSEDESPANKRVLIQARKSAGEALPPAQFWWPPAEA